MPINPTDVQRLMTPGMVTRRLGLSLSRVAALDREGLLRAMRDSSGRRLYDPDIVEAFARAREQRAARAEGAR